MELTCICNDSNCNVPFSNKLRNELLKFSYANLNNSNENLTEFFKSLDMNITDKEIYKRITVGFETTDDLLQNETKLTTDFVSTVTTTGLKQAVLPRAEAFQQNAATPSEDDEDESEGSGSYEETHNHQAAPAAPSSFLPANDNKATCLFTNILLFIPILVYLV